MSALCWLATDDDAESQAVTLEQVIAAVAGARKLKLVSKATKQSRLLVR